MAIHLTHLSKTISHALRHEPWVYELELDDSGWVTVAALLEALRETDKAFANVTLADIHAIMAKADKQRFELGNLTAGAGAETIRALYGHSIPGKLARTPITPPSALYHGTSAEAWAQIQKTGLQPMNRQYVHMSVDVATAQMVGGRKTKQPLILMIDTAAACKAGVAFYAGNEKVWLADAVPATFVRVQ